jgi:MGT family glycosyltransferase
VDQVMFGPAPLVCRDVSKVLAEEHFDLVVVDALMLAAHCAAEAAGVPSVHILHAPRADLGTVRDHVHRRVADLVFKRGLAPLNEARADLGLGPVSYPFAPLAFAQRILVCTSPTFDYGAARTSGKVCYVGPQLDVEATERQSDPWAWAPDRPRVLVSLSSTFMDQERLMHTVARALGELSVSGLITTGPAVDPASISVPPNVHVTQWARHADLLPQCSTVITHGGHGTVIKALGAGVPLVVSPQGRDQPANAKRVTHLGAGIRISKKPSVRSVRRAVGDILDNDRYSLAAMRFAERLSEERDEGLVVDELERAANGPGA